MKYLLHTLAAVVCLLSVQACSPITKVYSEEEPGVNLYKYHTFQWLDNMTVSQGNNGPEWLNQRAEKKIRSAVEDQLRRYAITPCTEKPDMILHYHVVIKNEVFFIRDWWCDEEIGGKYGRCHRIRPTNYREGTLIIDFLDARTGEQVWRGAAVGVLEHLNPEQADARIEEAVRLIFGKFPGEPVPGLSFTSGQ